MSNSSILGGTTAARQADGKDVDLLGPSDTSDSGSDVQGERVMPTAPDNPGEWGAVVSDGRTDTDAGGTGERGGAGGELVVEGADILPDRIVYGTELGADVERGDIDDLAVEEDDAGDDVEEGVTEPRTRRHV